jgi:copper chaperone CopZ
MIQTIVKIQGMGCGMCEADVNAAVRNAFAIKKVSSSYRHGETKILSVEPLDKEKLKKAINARGYAVEDFAESVL